MSGAESDKPYKVSQHRAERRTYRSILSARLDTDDRHLHGTVYGVTCLGPKDGKQYWAAAVSRDMRK